MNIFRVLYRYIRKTKFIILCIVSMVLFFSIIVGNIKNATKSILELNNQLTQNHIGISFNDNLKNQELVDLINKIKQNENIIIKYYLQTGFDYDVNSEGVYFNGIFNNSYNILEGRFFTNEDFKEDNNLAVIGKNVLKYTTLENNKRYILRGLDKYEVIGIIGKEELSSRYDDTILYNLNSVLKDNENLYRNTWWIDSETISRIDLEEIIKNVDNNGLIQVDTMEDSSPNPLNQAIKGLKTLIINFTLIILCVLLTLIMSILYWIDNISLEIGIRKNYGATNKDIFLDIVKRYILISIISIIVSLIFEKVLFKIKFLELLNYKISYINIILSSVFVIIVGVIFISISIYKINKTEINELLKGL